MFPPRGRFLGVMLGHLRSARPVRATLVLAAALGVGGSLGLHAEPGLARGERAATTAAAEAYATTGTVSAAHTCLLCLLFGSVSPSCGSSVAQGNLPCVPGVVTGQPNPEVSPPDPDRGGRAPPAFL